MIGKQLGNILCDDFLPRFLVHFLVFDFLLIAVDFRRPEMILKRSQSKLWNVQTQDASPRSSCTRFGLTLFDFGKNIGSQSLDKQC